MKTDVDRIIQEALQLPPEDRARVAGSLLDSLDEQADPDVEAAWAAEIERRVEEIKAGKAKLVRWPDVQTQIRAMLDDFRKT